MNATTAHVFSKARILVVDDEPNIRLLLRSTLETDGYTVIEATDGAEALSSMNDRSPDLVLLDLNMPVIDGLGVLKRLHQEPNGFKPRVVVLTAYGSIPAAVKATRYGALDFLEKPVTPDELRDTVAAVLREPEPAASNATGSPTVGYAAVLQKVRDAFRVADVTSAESLLMRVADLGQHDAAYFNLLGVLYEARSQWRLAQKFYGKALKAEKDYASALQNIRRVYELYTFGRSDEAVALGDEPGDAWFNRLHEPTRA
jgi:DNA-binding response OmpR family regulator